MTKKKPNAEVPRDDTTRRLRDLKATAYDLLVTHKRVQMQLAKVTQDITRLESALNSNPEE